ncbi:MAG: hypothetical protein ACMXYB_03830 [Candidatus Woesearchaeota archaeon]
MNRRFLIYLLVLAILLLFISIWLYSISLEYHSNNINNQITINTNQNELQTHKHSEDEFHIHADFLVILNETIMNFSKQDFMSELHNEQHSHVHLHDMNGNIIHYHKENITLEKFFTSLNMQFNQSCFTTHENISYCEDEINSLQMFVNGELNDEMQNYIAEDLDRILILFSNYSESQIEYYMNSVSDEACIYSMICEDRIPKGGVDSSCVTGASCLLDLDFLN